MLRSRVGVASVVCGLALLAGGFGPGPDRASARARPADWATYGNGLARQGVNSAERGLRPFPVTRLRPSWRTDVGGAVNTQPLVAHGVRVGRHRRDLLYVGTEDGRVVALTRRGGRVVWRRQLGSRRIRRGCAPSADGRFGVSGTLTLDRRSGRLYAVDGRGRAWALALGSGRTVGGWPVRVTHAGTSEIVWGALALSRGRLYVAVASPCDVGAYRGGVVAVDVGHPRRVRRWNAAGRFRGGAIWAWGGVAVDRRDGDVYVATGNASPPAREAAAFAEHVVRLSPGLRVKQSDDPLHPPFAIEDRDFGSTPVLFDAKGCPPQLVVLAKTGELFLYDRDHLDRGPRQRMVVAAVARGHVPLIGLPAADPAARTLVLLTPADAPAQGLHRGLLALRLTRRCRLATRWQRDLGLPASGSQPTIANGVVYVAMGRSNFVRAFALKDGATLWARKLSLAVFAAPTVIDGAVFEADWTGAVWAFRPR
jgi:outer membrane protein assembly factor BamB